MLGVLGLYFEQPSSEPPRPESGDVPRTHTIEISDIEAPADPHDPFLIAIRAARVLGRQTAEMHLALASRPEDAAFAPEFFTTLEIQEQGARLVEESGRVLATLRNKITTLEPDIRPLADRVVRECPALVKKTIDGLEGIGPLVKIRVHGDYHLGQVLRRDDDFVILDFEGEPGRSLTERRAKQSPLKDVAGMLRSFHYAAYTAMMSHVRSGLGIDETIKRQTINWLSGLSLAFVEEYHSADRRSGLVQSDQESWFRYLRFHLVEKAMFEIRYELNYRPDWVQIPLLGVERWLEEQ